jgi:hypothetical protein
MIFSAMSKQPSGPQCLFLFADYSDFEIPIDSKFSLLKKIDAASPSYSIDGQLVMVTQQFFKPFDCVPQGWKTILEIKFDTQSLELIKSKLGVSDSWGSNAFLLYTETGNLSPREL